MKRKRSDKTPEESLKAIREIMVQMVIEYTENNHHIEDKDKSHLSIKEVKE